MARGRLSATGSFFDGSAKIGTTLEEPFIDFSSGYVLRAIDKFPRQGSRPPWRLYQNYALDIVKLRYGAIEDGAMQFSTNGRAQSTAEALAA